MDEATVQTREKGFLDIFQKITQLTSMMLDHQQVMDTVVTKLPDLIGVDACTIRLLDKSTNTFVLGAANGLSLEYLSRSTIDTEETMEMIKSGHPVAKTNIADDDTFEDRDAAEREGIKSVLALPILFHGAIIGIMRLLTKKEREFSLDEVSFSMVLAEQIGIAISNARMFSEMEQQVDFMREVQEISKVVNSSLDLNVVLQAIVERVPRSIGAMGCTIRLFNPLTNKLELVAGNGLSEDYLNKGQVEKEKSISMVLSGEPVTVYDVATDERVKYRGNMQVEGIKSLLAVPIKVDKEVIGVLRVLTNEYHFFTNAEVNFALTIAEAGGAAIQNARNYTKINLLFNQIEENERFLADILNCIRPQLFVVDRNKHIVMANQVFLKTLNKSETEVLGMEYNQICSADGSDSACPVHSVLDTGVTTTFTHKTTVAGEEKILERTASPMFGEDGKVEYVIEVIRDVTVKRKLEEEQKKRIKLEGVVELAGTVAHEINTPLFAALGTAQMLEEDLHDASMKEDCNVIIRNLKSIGSLTKKMTAMTGFEKMDYVGDASIINFT